MSNTMSIALCKSMCVVREPLIKSHLPNFGTWKRFDLLMGARNEECKALRN